MRRLALPLLALAGLLPAGALALGGAAPEDAAPAAPSEEAPAGDAGEAPLSADSGPREVVAALVAAAGGHAALAKVTAYRVEGTILALARHERGRFVRRWSRPLDLDVTLRYPSGPERRLLVGGRGWRSRPRGFVEVQGPLLASMVLQAARAGLPWLLDERRDAVVAAEPWADPADGPEIPPLPGARLPLEGGLDIAAWVDPATGRLRRSLARMRLPRMGVDFEVRYADHQDVGGIVLPLAEDTFAGGTATSHMAIEAVELNPARAVEAPAPPR